MAGGAGASGAGAGAGGAGAGGTVLPTIEPLSGGLPEFNLAAVVQEGYWYSRYNLGSLVMKSALGEVFMPPADMPPMLAMMVSDAVSTAQPPMNPALLKRVANAGNPALAAADDGMPMNLADDRWSATLDTSTTAAAAGWTLLKELEWGKQFHVDSHFGIPGASGDKPGAQQRFEGLVMYAEALMQGMEVMNNAAAFDMTDVGGSYVLLAALSDLQMVTAANAVPHSATNRMRKLGGMMATSMGMGDETALTALLLQKIDGLYAQIKTREPADLEDLSLAAVGLAWYGAASPTNRAEVKERARTYGDRIIAAPRPDALAQARAIRGLAEVARIVGDARYQRAAGEAFIALAQSYQGRTGSFTGVTRLSVDDVAWVVAAMGEMLVAGTPEQADAAEKLLVGFHEAVINLGGLQISAPPVTEIAAYERLALDLLHRYPTTPTPREAGGQFGLAPVLASEITFDAASGKYTAPARDRFDTAGAMHLANVMLWLHVDEVSGYPIVP